MEMTKWCLLVWLLKESQSCVCRCGYLGKYCLVLVGAVFQTNDRVVSLGVVIQGNRRVVSVDVIHENV